MIRLCRETKCRVHIVHLSSSEALAELKRAKQEGLPITAETCPHYLCFSAENIPEGRTEFKCAPPIRESENRERLWTALEEGVIDFIVSDHSPCSPDKKCLDSGDFGQAWGGISSLQLGLPAIWTEARRRGYSLADVSRWMSLGPALFSGLKNKGELAAGRDADLVVFDPDQTFIVKPEAIRHRHKLTPYAGLALSGVVKTTFLRGQKIYDEGIFAGPFGRTLLQRELHKTT
jgi:allantoinase